MKLADTFMRVFLCEAVSVPLGPMRRLAQVLSAHAGMETCQALFQKGGSASDPFQRHVGDQGFLACLLCHFRSLDSGETRSWPQSPCWFLCLPLLPACPLLVPTALRSWVCPGPVRAQTTPPLPQGRDIRAAKSHTSHATKAFAVDTPALPIPLAKPHGANG